MKDGMNLLTWFVTVKIPLRGVTRLSQTIYPYSGPKPPRVVNEKILRSGHNDWPELASV
jgi:hypothetical protein